MTDVRQTKEYALYMSQTGWRVEKVNGIYCYIRKIPILGNFIKVQRPKKVLSQSHLLSLRKKYHPYQIIIEPQNTKDADSLTKNGFKQSRSPYIPSKTILIDVTKSLKTLLSSMHYKTRYNIKIAEKRGVKIVKSQDIKTFNKLWHHTKFDRNLLPLNSEIENLYKAFAGKSTLFFADYNNQTVAGVLLIHTKDISYYMYAFSSKLGKSLFAPTLLVWKSLAETQKQGCHYFDFEGIYDNRFPIKSWLGFTRFKKSFGGQEVEHPGAFSKFYIFR